MTRSPVELTIVRSVDYENDSRWNYEINLYPYHSLYFVLAGDGFVQIGAQRTALLPGHVYLIPANTIYRCWCETHIHKLYVELSVETVPGCDIFSGLHTVREAPASPEIIHRLIEASNREELKHQLYFRGELERTLSEFADESLDTPDKAILEFKPVLDDVVSHLSARLRIADIAKRHGYSPVTLSRKFKKAFGCSLKVYVENLLRNRIKRDMIVTSKTMRKIAEELSFCDAYYLSAFFKKREGVSPSEYRRQNGMRFAARIQRGKDPL